jgi:CRP-like cAMP-binding protein
VDEYLESTGAARRILKYRRGAVVYSQGDRSNDVRYLQEGAVKLSTLSRFDKEAVVGMLVPGDFFGEGALTSRVNRFVSARRRPWSRARS